MTKINQRVWRPEQVVRWGLERISAPLGKKKGRKKEEVTGGFSVASLTFHLLTPISNFWFYFFFCLVGLLVGFGFLFGWLIF